MHKLHLLTPLAILIICATFNIASRGVLDFYAVFILPLTGEFGWSRTQISSVYSLAFIVTGLSGPLVGWCFDRFGPVFNYIVGSLIIGIGLYLCAQITSLWQLYIFYAVIVGFGVTFFANVTGASLLRRWFTKRLNTAIAASYASASIGMITFAPAAQAVITDGGWRLAFQITSLLMLVGLPLTFALWILKAGRGRSPQIESSDLHNQAKQNPPAIRQVESVKAGLSDPAFWGLSWVFVATGIGMYTVLLQIPAFLVEQGYDAQFAATAFGMIGVLAPVGMVSFALLGDRFGRRNIVLISFAMTALGIASLFVLHLQPSLFWLAMFIFFFGGSFGARGPAISAIAAGLFAGPKFASIYGYLTIFMGSGAAIGSWLGGYCRDATGTYTLGISLSFVAIMLGPLPFVFLQRIAKAK